MMIKNLTLEEVKDICLKHQKQNKNCEDCRIYKFCICEFTNCPSEWDLDKYCAINSTDKDNKCDCCVIHDFCENNVKNTTTTVKK